MCVILMYVVLHQWCLIFIADQLMLLHQNLLVSMVSKTPFVVRHLSVQGYRCWNEVKSASGSGDMVFRGCHTLIKGKYLRTPVDVQIK